MNISVESLYFSDLSFSDIRDLQSYNPIYSCSFLSQNKNTDNNNKQSIGLNHIGLNQKYEIHSLEDVVDKQLREIVEKPIFIKYSPLLDPLQYLLGKYDGYGDQIRTLPTIDSSLSENTFTKLTNYNNSSYIDCFFYYLTGQLLHYSGFIHGIEYYGSYLGIQENFKMNVVDDIEYLQSHPLFLERMNKTYFIDPENSNSYHFSAREEGGNSRGNKHKLKISSSSSNISIHSIVDDLSNVPNKKLQVIENNAQENTIETIYERNNNSKKSSSTNTSNNSEVNYTTDGEEEDEDEEDEKDEDEDEDEDNNEDNSEDEEDDEDNSEDDLFLYIKDFPCQLICIEKCDGTLDELFTQEMVDKDLGSSCIFQIIMTLIMYQNKFKFTHNDLHTNNIMYKNTDITHLIYHYRNKIYKVPTYGKIFKIIDFGRSIYEVNGQTFCSDSFQKHGDGHSQYNFEPFYNPLKPKILPNMSFDLCRLGCSIYDFIIDEDEDFEELDLFQKLIYTWCLDDNGKNVLYKRSGEERYPNFKLYKMIARTVHQHIPENQLDNALFRDFCLSPTLGKKKNKKREKIYEIHFD